MLDQMTSEILTDRLRLRGWLPTDRAPFAMLNADPRVMEHFVSTLSRERSDALASQFETTFDRYGFGFWAVEVPGMAAFVGFVGLSVPHFQTHFTPCVEIGWRLSAEYWDRGYATEGARAALQFGFDAVQLREIVALTVPSNPELPNKRLQPSAAWVAVARTGGTECQEGAMQTTSELGWLSRKPSPLATMTSPTL